MDTEELESKLQAGTETPTLEFKGACEWDVRSLAKDILAMSNVRDGGHIIFGVKDGSFKRQGVSKTQADSFNVETMRDQMSDYADPHVRFDVYFPADLEGKNYVVIKVFPFEDVPVICKKDGSDVCAGVIYYRNKNKKVESAHVSNSYDMRDIIETAAVRKMQKFFELGLDAGPTSQQQVKKELNEELQGL